MSAGKTRKKRWVSYFKGRRFEMAGCFGKCLECLQGPSYTVASSYAHLDDLPAVKLDTSYLGSDVVVVKNGRRVCGTGAALANAPIVQNKAFFEVKIQQMGTWGLGLSTRKTDLNKLPLGCDGDSWVLRDNGKFYHKGEVVSSLPETVEEGDVVGLAFDHVDLSIFRNGDLLDCTISGIIRGTVYPIVYVDDGAILDVEFKNFWFRPPAGFEEIMLEQTLL